MKDRTAVLTENLGVAVFAFNREYEVVYANKAAEEITGYTNGELKQLSVPHIIHPDFKDFIIHRAFYRLLAKNTGGRYETKILKKNGDVRWIDLTAGKASLDGQDVVAITAVDISANKALEKELQSSRRDLVSLINNLPGIAFRCYNDDQYTMVFLSQMFEEITGYKIDDVLWNSRIAYNEIIYPEDRPRLRKAVHHSLTYASQYQEEYRIITRSGQVKWLYEQGRAFANRKGGNTFVEGIILDVTSRKHAEESQNVAGRIAELSMQEVEFDNKTYFASVQEILSGLINTRSFSIIHYDSTHDRLKVLYSSDELFYKEVETVEYARKTLTYKVIRDNKPFLLDDERIHELKQKGEVNIYGRKGKQWMGIPLKLMDGNRGAIVLQNYDSVESYNQRDMQVMELIAGQISMAINRKDAQKALKEREQYYRSLFMNMPESYQLLDDQGCLLVVNEKWTEVMGYSPEEVLGKRFDAFWGPGMEESFEDFCRHIREQGRRERELLKMKTKQGTTLDVVFNAQAEQDQLGNILKTHCVFSDVTPLKEMERAMRNAKEKAEENDKLKSAFLANMSHEIRSPMNAILGASQMLKKKNLKPEKTNRFLKLIEDRGEDLVRIIDDIIDFSKLEAGTLKLFYETINLNNFLNNLHMEFSQERKREGKEHIAFLQHRGPGVEDLRWKTDKVRLRQILMNFLSNALKFTNEGHIMLIVKQSADHMIFAVEDTGIGIAPQHLDSVFERFRQVDLNYKSSRSGTGLGLSISQNLAQKMNGHIHVKSKKGKGSTFSLKIPLKQKTGESKTTEQTEQEKPQKNGREKRKEERPTQYKDRNVLVADHNYDHFLHIKTIAQSAGVNVLWANSASQVLKVLTGKLACHMILMEVRLPDVDGRSLAKIIRKKYPQIPLVALTEMAFHQDKKEAVQHGFHDYITKPLSKELVLAMLDKYLKTTDDKTG